MAKAYKRVVDTSFWEDPKVIDSFTPEDKLFMLYLLTNPHTTQVGIYTLPYRVAAFETGYNTDSIKSMIRRFRDTYGVIRYSPITQEVAILNSLKHSIVKGGKPVEDCIKKELSEVKDVHLVYDVASHLDQWWDSSRRTVDKAVKQLFINELKRRKVTKEVNIEDENENENENERIDYDSSNDSSKEKSPSLPFSKIISFLNDELKANNIKAHNFKSTTRKTRELILARVHEGFDYDDFKTVITYFVKSWKGTKYEDYLRPSTLFNGSFEDRLTQAKSHPDKLKQNENKKQTRIEIVEYLNAKTRNSFSPDTDTTKGLIDERLSEGRTVKDFKKVIDTAISEWSGKKTRNGENAEGLVRPDILFKDKTFERLLNIKKSSNSGNGGYDERLFAKVEPNDLKDLPF